MAFSDIISKLEVKSSKGTGKNSMLDNADLRPVPKADRTWGFWTWNVFWFSAVTNSSNFLTGASFLSAGLTVWQGILANTMGFLMISIIMVLNGRCGAVYHIGFPAYCRSSFGIVGSVWPVLNRVVMSCVWQGVNAVSGAQAIYIMLHAIFPSIARIPNHMGAGSALTSAQMICFFLFAIATLGVCQLSIPKWGFLIHAKLASFVISAAGLLALTLTKAGGIGNTLSEPSTLQGAEKAWTIVRFFLLAAASCSTFASNATDFQRNSTTANSPILGQIIGFPISNFIVTLIGMVVASSSIKVYGELVWNPLVYLDMLLTDNYDSKTRAGCFFIGFGFAYGSLFSAVFENLLPCGNDVAALLPRFLSIKRGFWVCVFVSIIICPWYLLGSASIFITVLASYQIFLFSIIGILLTDYYIVSRGYIEIDRLFDADTDGPYWYTKGVNLRAFIAYFCGIAVNFAGFLQNLGVIEGTPEMQKAYWFSCLTTTTCSGLVYWSLSKVRPQPNNRKGRWLEPKEYISPDDPWWSEQRGGEEGVVMNAEVSQEGNNDMDEKHWDGKDRVNGEASVYVLPAEGR